MNKVDLIEWARMVRNRAYAPYSEFKVGAAILGRSGQVYIGCNVENASYGLTICAERAAAARAIADGEREFVCLALVGSGEGFTYPCGACLQVLAEFAPRLRIIMVNEAGQIRENLLEELLPQVFALNREEFNGG